MSAGLVATRYAKALFHLLGKNPEEAKKHVESLKTIEALFATPDGGKVLNSPIMPPELKKELLDYALKEGGAAKVIGDFVGTVAEAGRTALLPQMIFAFNQLILEANGIVAADLRTATDLDQASVDKIAEEVGVILGKKLAMNVKTDKDLLGGFVIDVGNYTVDMSLKSRIDKLAQNAAQL